jgi:hypothetical protein
MRVAILLQILQSLSRPRRECPAMRAFKRAANIAQFRSSILWMRLEPGRPLGRNF